MGIKFTDIHKQNMSKPVYQYDLNDNFIKEWTSIKEVFEILRLRISHCLMGNCKTAGGYIWKYK